MERPRGGCVNLPYLAGTKKRPVKKGPYKLISPSKYKHSWVYITGGSQLERRQNMPTVSPSIAHIISEF